MNKIISVFLLFFLALMVLPIAASNQGEYQHQWGKVLVVDDNHLAINRIIYPTNENTLVVYLDYLSSYLLNKKDIPTGAYGLAIIDGNNCIERLELAGYYQDSIDSRIHIEKVLTLDELFYEFQLSADGRYLAYFSPTTSKIHIRDMSTGYLVYQNKVKGFATYVWHPSENQLYYSFHTNDFYGIKAYDLVNGVDILIYQGRVNGFQAINNLSISPASNQLAYTVLEGLESSQGYISTIQVLDSKGNLTDLGDLANVNSLAWSNDGTHILYSQFLEDLVSNKVGIHDLQSGLEIIIEGNSSYTYPILSQDNNWDMYLIQSEGMVDKIFAYSINEDSWYFITEDFTTLRDLTWLNKDTLAYACGGYISYIKAVNITSGETITIGEGIAPIALDNTLFFINHAETQTFLYKYQAL